MAAPGAKRHNATRRLAWTVHAGVAFVLLLLLFGWSMAPGAASVAPVAELAAYVVLAQLSVFVAGTGGSRAQWVILACGISSAAVLIRPDLVQYFGRTANNAITVAVVTGLWLVADIVAEGAYDDFVRSGAGDFGAFVIGDFFGGAFFHLLSGVIFGALSGAIGGALTIVSLGSSSARPTLCPTRRLRRTASPADDRRG